MQKKDRSLRQLLQGVHQTRSGAAEGCDLLILTVLQKTQSVVIRECLRVSFMVTYTSKDTAMHAVTYQ